MCGWLSGQTGFSCCSSASCGRSARCRRGRYPLMGSQYQHLVFSSRFFAGLYISPLIQIAAVHACKIGSVIDNDRPLTFENQLFAMEQKSLFGKVPGNVPQAAVQRSASAPTVFWGEIFNGCFLENYISKFLSSIDMLIIFPCFQCRY